jgi:hypothetical protein
MNQESSALSNTVSVHQVVPRLKPGGKKILKSGLVAQGTFLLFQQITDFTEMKKLFFNHL